MVERPTGIKIICILGFIAAFENGHQDQPPDYRGTFLTIELFECYLTGGDTSPWFSVY